MKRIIFFFCLIILLNACKSKRSYFEVKGKIIHPIGKTVYLKMFTIGVQNPILVDTFNVSPAGNFELKTTMPLEQSLFALSQENGPDVYLINDAPEINVYLDNNQYKKYKLTGSAASTQLQSFLEAYNNQYSVLKEKITQYDSALQSNKSDSMILVYKGEKDKSLKEINQLILSNIKQSAASPALSSYLLAKSFATMDKNEIAKLIGASTLQFKGYAPIAFLNNVIQAQLKLNAPNPLIGKKVPAFVLTDSTGKRWSTDSIAGKYALIDFWASWCKPCVEEIPNLSKAIRDYKNKNFTIVSISLDSNLAAWKRTVKNEGMYWQQLNDKRAWESPIVKQYSMNALPFNVLIDTTGNVIAVNLRGRELSLKLNELLK